MSPNLRREPPAQASTTCHCISCAEWPAAVRGFIAVSHQKGLSGRSKPDIGVLPAPFLRALSSHWSVPSLSDDLSLEECAAGLLLCLETAPMLPQRFFSGRPSYLRRGCRGRRGVQGLGRVLCVDHPTTLLAAFILFYIACEEGRLRSLWRFRVPRRRS